MKELTDEMVQKSINNFNSSWLVILVILLIFSIIFICLIFNLKKNIRSETIDKKRKNLKMNIIGLSIAFVISIILEIGCISTYLTADKNKNRWRVEINTITNLSHHTEYDNNDNDYEVYNAKVGNYSRKVKISEKEYYRLKNGDTVYVAVSGKSLPVDLWSTDDYTYTGNHLE